MIRLELVWEEVEEEVVCNCRGFTRCVYGGHLNFNQDSADTGSRDNVDN